MPGNGNVQEPGTNGVTPFSGHGLGRSGRLGPDHEGRCGLSGHDGRKMGLGHGKAHMDRLHPGNDDHGRVGIGLDHVSGMRLKHPGGR